MAKGDEFQVVYVDGDVPQLPIQLGQLLVDSSLVSPGNTNLQQCTSQVPLIYEGIAAYSRQTAAETAAGVTPTNFYIPSHEMCGYVIIERYGTNTTPGTTDMLTAFNNAILVSTAARHATIMGISQYYMLSGTVTMHEGIMIVFPGAQGSTPGYGCTVIHRSNNNLFVWDGNGASALGTGGGMKNVLIIKDDGFSGGYALHIVATDDNHRPGEMFFENILAYGQGTGLWARGLNVDGSACVTPGAKGVRSIVGVKLRFADCIDNLRYVSLNQVEHCTLAHLQIDTGDGTGTVGMTIEGDSQNINLPGAVINGTLAINSAALAVSVDGRVSTLDVNYTSATGTFTGTSTAITNASPSFKISSPGASAVQAVRTSDVADVTGDGTVYTVLFDNDSTAGSFDIAGNYNPATGIFTCTQAGKYWAKTRVTWKDLAATHTRADLGIERRDSGGTLSQYPYRIVNPANAFITGGYYSQEVSELLQLAEGDTLRVVTAVTGNPKVVDIEGSDLLTTFSVIPIP